MSGWCPGRWWGQWECCYWGPGGERGTADHEPRGWSSSATDGTKVRVVESIIIVLKTIPYHGMPLYYVDPHLSANKWVWPTMQKGQLSGIFLLVKCVTVLIFQAGGKCQFIMQSFVYTAWAHKFSIHQSVY